MNPIAVGRVVRTLGHLIAVALPTARVGEGVRVYGPANVLRGRIADVERGHAVVAPFGAVEGIAAGDRVETSPDALMNVLGYGALGRAFDALGVPLDREEPLRGALERVSDTAATATRREVSEPWWTGVRALDGLLTFGRGARIGLFGAPGAGKTTLLESIARHAAGDAVVVGLVGERGREAASWLRRADARATIVCATADRPAAERVRAAEVAMAQAVTLRDRGLNVVLIVDSLARYAMALREVRAGLGEPVGRGGYPPSVLAALSRYMERAGTTENGSITAVVTVLSDGADEREPLSDAARAALDGHIALSSELARGGRFPAIDVLASASRTMRDVVDAEHRASADSVRAALALLADTRDLRSLGLTESHDPSLARAVAAEPAIIDFLVQREPADPRETITRLGALAARL